MRLGVALLSFCVFFSVGCADRNRSSIADGMLEVSARELDFDRVALHNWKELELTLTNVGRGPISLDGLSTEDAPPGNFHAEFTEEGPHRLYTGDSVRVKVKFTPKQDGQMEGQLVIQTDDRASPRSNIPIRGRGLDARARLTAGDFNFGRIEAESTKTLTFSAVNPSEIPVDVYPRVLGTDRDEFVADRVTLAPGEKRDFAFTFAPTRIGKKVAMMSISPCRGCGDEVYNVAAEALDRAILAVPAEIDLGQVPIDRVAEGKVRLVNISTEPMQLTEMKLQNTDPSFTMSTMGFPTVIGPGETREWLVRYTPGHMGIAEGQTVFGVRSKRNPTTAVAVRAFGGSPELCISPLNFDFGKVPVGAKISQLITIKNCGSSNGDPLTVNSLVFGGSGPQLPGEDQFSLGAVALPRTLKAGEQMTVKAVFEPLRAGVANATLNVRSSAFAAAHLKVGFAGTAETHAPCSVSVTPGALEFGNVPPGKGAVLGIKVENRGLDLCAVKNVKLSNDAGGVFKLPGGELDGHILSPGMFFSFMVSFNPPANGGDFAGAAQVEPADPAHPVVTIPIAGHSIRSCLAPAPPFLDFGNTRPDCPGRPLKTSLINICSTPVALENVAIGAGTTDGEFTVTGAPPTLPLNLNPGDAVSLTVVYEGRVRGMNLSPLFLRVSGETNPVLVALVGESTATAELTDKFVQQDGSKVDVLFVVDNTKSMVEEHPKLVAAVPTFVSEALGRQVDLHVAVTTTGIETVSAECPGGAEGGEAGRIFPVDGSRPRLLTSATANLAGVLQENVKVGQCAMVEKGFEAVRRALSTPLVDSADDPRTPQLNDGNAGFLRDEAALAVVFVGDEDDHSPDDVDTYVKFLQNKKGSGQPGRATVYAIAPTAQACATAGGTGTRYDEAATKTGGAVLSICEADYAPLMKSLAAKAFSPQSRFPLTGQPDTSSLAVLLNGQPSGSGWSYDGATNSIVFNQTPAAGTRIEVNYRRICPR